MPILHAADHRRMPWKNGGGETTEIAVHPPAAGLDDFIWRLSMATVAQSGPFSLFAGVERTLAVIDGDGLHLRFGEASLALTVQSEPTRFPADAPADAHLPGGTVTDLNIMTRRGRADHRMRRLAIEGRMALALTGTPSLLVCTTGAMAAAQEGDLAPGDCIVTSAARLDLEGQGIALLVEILPAR